eukprot:TRINITY_DN24365_c0_g1_i1.p1 TRINITY_DN24365_c0_g1~~TRINITY_DN24365_c0_g1_i1.p1  ORF type:complete len:354 (-),score=61.58 TRINITY_DN24365_c0_g1_i1:316-1377(-)
MASTHVIKVLAPQHLASAILGRGGSSVEAMRQSTGASIGLSAKDDHYPGTDHRVLTCGGDDVGCLDEVCKQLVEKLAEAASGHPSDSLGSGDSLKVMALMPRAAVGGLIGKGGTYIKQLREETNTRIGVSEPYGSGPEGVQVVTVTGKPDGLVGVLQEINKQVQALNTESWWEAWATEKQRGKASYGNYSDRYDYGDSYSYEGYDSYDSNYNYGESSRRSGGRGRQRTDPGVEELCRIAHEIPDYVTQDSRGFAMSCVVPSSLVGGLIGRGGAGTKEVQQATGTKIAIREVPGDPENRQLNISGPLPNTCAAYMLMMKRYLDAEASAQASTSSYAHDDSYESGHNNNKGWKRR